MIKSQAKQGKTHFRDMTMSQQVGSSIIIKIIVLYCMDNELMNFLNLLQPSLSQFLKDLRFSPELSLNFVIHVTLSLFILQSDSKFKMAVLQLDNSKAVMCFVRASVPANIRQYQLGGSKINRTDLIIESINDKKLKLNEEVRPPVPAQVATPINDGEMKQIAPQGFKHPFELQQSDQNGKDYLQYQQEQNFPEKVVIIQTELGRLRFNQFCQFWRRQAETTLEFKDANIYSSYFIQPLELILQ